MEWKTRVLHNRKKPTQNTAQLLRVYVQFQKKQIFWKKISRLASTTPFQAIQYPWKKQSE